MHPGDLYELTRDCILRVFLRILWRPQIRPEREKEEVELCAWHAVCCMACPCMALLRELRGERATSAAIGIQIHFDMRICAYL